MKFKHLIFALIFLTACQNETIIQSDKFIYIPIGKIISSNTPATGAPRQGMLLPETKAVIELDPVYEKSLFFLDSFEYITVLYHFNLAEGWESMVRPPESHHEFGLFATRVPRRPNPIGFTVVKIDSIVKNNIYISGNDAFNGTPVLDIKPYLPSVDCPKSKINEKAEDDLGHHDQDFLTDTIYK